MSRTLLEKNRCIVETAAQIVLGLNEPISNKDLAQQLVSSGSTDIPLASTMRLLRQNLPNHPDILCMQDSLQKRGQKSTLWARRNQSPPDTKPAHALKSVWDAQQQFDQKAAESRATLHTLHSSACTTYPRRETRTYWVCSNGNEFSVEVDALRHELDLVRERRR